MVWVAQTKKKVLINEISVSDDTIINQIEVCEIITVTYILSKRFVDYLMANMMIEEM